MKLFIGLIIFYLFLSHSVLASGDPVSMGGRSWALANTNITLTDGWSVYNNVGGLARLKESYLLAACDVRYNMLGFTTVAVAGALPTSYGTFGLSIDRYGDQLYNEQRLGVAYSHQMDRVSLGVKANYVQVAIAEIGASRRLVFEFGGIAEITPQLFFGAHVYNFNQARLVPQRDERIPTVLKAGLSWRPVPQVMLNAETEKDTNFPTRVKVGLEYQIAKPFFLRTGIATTPGTQHFGFGFNGKKLGLDYALRTHPSLGLSHHLSLSLKVKQKSDGHITDKSQPAL